jgi:hypothetical protein
VFLWSIAWDKDFGPERLFTRWYQKQELSGRVGDMREGKACEQVYYWSCYGELGASNSTSASKKSTEFFPEVFTWRSRDRAFIYQTCLLLAEVALGILTIHCCHQYLWADEQAPRKTVTLKGEDTRFRVQTECWWQEMRLNPRRTVH